MQDISPSSSTSASSKRSLFKKIKAAIAKGEEHVDGYIFAGVFIPNNTAKRL